MSELFCCSSKKVNGVVAMSNPSAVNTLRSISSASGYSEEETGTVYEIFVNLGGHDKAH